LLIRSISGLLSSDLAIDLGTANTLISVQGKGVILSEPSVVSIQKGTNRVVAIGAEAKRMLGRAPESIEVVRPLRCGVIADFECTMAMLR
jgi:rod shape-determining protein MreB